MIKYLIYCCLSFVVFDASAQLLDINSPLFTDDPFFNTQFIKENNIKAITGSRSSKKIADIIRTKGLDFYYEFNKKGQLTKQIATFLVGGLKKDTNIITYKYNNKGSLVLRRKSDNYGYFSHQYQFDSLNRIIKQTYSRDENKFTHKGDFELCKQYKISSDSFSFERLSDQQVKKYYYNNYGKIYKQQTNYYNEFGYLIEKYAKFLIGNNKSKLVYEYDENGRLIKQINFSDISNDKKIIHTYEYDNQGNVLYIKIFNNEEHISTKQFLYDEKTMLLTAQIIQDIKSQLVKIVQYEYTFFEENNGSLEISNNPN